MRAHKLVLKRFALGQTQANGPFLDLQGRAPGGVSFLMNVLGVDPTLSMRCFHDRIEIIEASLAGQETIVIPMSCVSSIQGGHTRSLRALAAVGVFAMLGVLGAFAGLVASESGPALAGAVFWFFLAAMALVSFYLSRSMVLSVQNGGDKAYGLRFGQGVVEGVDVNPARVQEAVALLNRATMQATQAAVPAPSAPGFAPVSATYAAAQ